MIEGLLILRVRFVARLWSVERLLTVDCWLGSATRYLRGGLHLNHDFDFW